MSKKLALDSLRSEMDGNGNTPAYWNVCGEFAERYPNLFDLLYRTKFNEQHRAPGRLSLFMDEGTLKVGVFLDSERQMAFLTLSNPEEVFLKLERKLSTTGLEWRPMRGGRSRLRNQPSQA